MPSKWQQWYPHDIDAWQGSIIIQDLSDSAYRAVHNLLMAQFQSEDGMLPAEEKELARLSRKRQVWDQIRDEVLDCFETGGDDRIYNSRMYQEWAEAKVNFEKRHGSNLSPEELSELRSRAGKKGAEVKWQNHGKPDGKTMASAIKTMAKPEENMAKDSLPNLTRPNQTEPIKPTPRKSAAVIPEWVPLESWNGFIEMRKKIRAPLTDRAVTETIRKLDQLAKSGHDPGAVLDQSTQRGWRGIFEVKTGGGNGNNDKYESRNARVVREALASLDDSEIGAIS
jgi:uncharacterized protein YdaU (DUF1376 family)